MNPHYGGQTAAVYITSNRRHRHRRRHRPSNQSDRLQVAANLMRLLRFFAPRTSLILAASFFSHHERRRRIHTAVCAARWALCSGSQRGGRRSGFRGASLPFLCVLIVVVVVKSAKKCTLFKWRLFLRFWDSKHNHKAQSIKFHLI